MIDVNTPIDGKLDVSYKGYTGSYKYETKEDCDPYYKGFVLGINDAVYYAGCETLSNLQFWFEHAVDRYIEGCEKSNKTPQLPKTYDELLIEFCPPTFITTKMELDETKAVAHKLCHRGRLTTEEEHYVAALLLITKAYEMRTPAVPSTPKLEDYLFEYSIRGGNTLLLRVAAESRTDAVNLFFENVARCFYDKDSGIGSVTIIRVIHLDKVSVLPLKKLDNT